MSVQDVKNELIKKLTTIKEKVGITQAELAKKLGLNAGALSSWLKGKYEGNNEDIEQKVKKYLELQEEKIKGEIPNLEFVKTSVADRVFTAARACQVDCEIGIAHGASGLGKTTAIKEYAKNNTGVIVLEVEEGYTSKILIQELYEQLGFSGNATVHKMKKEITAKLKDSGWLIIVDEAEHLKVGAFTTLRRIHDKTDYSFGLLFVGLRKLYGNLLRLKGDFEYVTNRVGYNFELNSLTREDVEMMVKTVVNDDKQIIEKYWEASEGNARVLSKTLKRSLRLAQANNIPVNEKMILKSRRMLIA